MRNLSIELEITLRCNRECQQCNRHCNMFGPQKDSDMSLEQIDKFIAQIAAQSRRINKVVVMGGEPTIHPLFSDITYILGRELLKKKRIKRLALATNGDNLKCFSPELLGTYSYIKVAWEKLTHQYVLAAPVDLGQRQKFCTVPRHCGITLNKWGYWPCGPGGAIARLFQFPQRMGKYQLFELPESFEEFEKRDENGNYESLCGLCQWSVPKSLTITPERGPSSAYVEAIEKFDSNLKLEVY